MQATVDQQVELDSQLHFQVDQNFYLHDLVCFLREALILSGLEEPLERGAIVVL